MKYTVAIRGTNTFCVQPRSDQDRELLGRVLDASASLWNQLNYVRRQQFFDGGRFVEPVIVNVEH